MKKALLLLAFLSVSSLALAQRITDKLDRGLVAVPLSTGNFVSWRVLGEEYYDVTYNLYCNGSKIASNLKVSNYSHSAGNASSSYQVAAVVRGVEQEKCAAVKRWENGMLTIPVQAITGRDGTDVTSHYTINDISMGDLDGDGVVEFICKRPCDVASDPTQKNCFHVLDAYDRTGKRLWWIDLGPNMLAGADEQWDCVCYDWDQDGKAEVLLRIQDNAYIHFADSTTELIGSSTVDTRWSGIEYTSSGNEYLLYLEGATGKPYQIGPASHPDYMDYPNPRGTDSDWGTGIVGHRSTKHYFAAPYLDGRHPSIFLGRGCYTKHMMKAFDVDPATHALTQRWAWECSTSGPWFGQGYHNFQVADVDWDGRDEIVFGSMIIDDNGKGLSTTGLGHGDAQHCSDFDPYTHGQEQFACNEDQPACNYRNATTSKIRYRLVATSDDGRALMANFSNEYPGSQGRSVNSGVISSVSDKIISEEDANEFLPWADLNQRIYWDGDLCDEYFDSPGTEGYGAIYKVGGGRWNFGDSKCNNWTKNNPAAIGDIFGDWREELVMRKSDNTAILVYSTNISTSYRLPTLWSDTQYRNAMVWQSMGYNQPPHKSYFVGQLEGITVAPPTNTMTGRTEVANGGTITTTDEHLIVCETGNTDITIQEGAAPYMLTFNVPTWVQGSAASNTTTKETPITTETYTCNVTGGALTGSMRLVKQGDGVLNLPAVDMTYTGETNIWAGTLNFNGTLKNSPLWLNRFAALNSNGTFRKIKADYASTIRPGGEDTKGSITTDTLALGFGSRVQLDVYSDGLACDQINTKLITVETKSGTAWEKYGPEYLTPVIEVVAHKASGENLLATGDYILGDAGTVTGDLGDIKIEGVSGQKCELKIADGKLVLSITGVRDASTIYWTGDESTIWDYANAMNFSNEGTKDFFVSNDKVIFDDAATNFTVSLKGDLDPDTIRFNNTKAYTINGTGAIVGAATVVKEGTGTLTIANDNTYTGSTIIRGGTVKVNSLSNANQANGNLGVVSTNTSHITLENGAALQTTADVTMGSPIRGIGTEGGVLNVGSGFVMNSAMYGTRLTKKGTGYMTLYANSTSLDTLAIAQGTIAVSCDTPAKVLELQGGTVNMNNGSATPINVPKGKTAVLNCYADRGVYSNRLTGAGTITISYPVVVGSGWYADRASFTGNWSTFEGTVKPTAVQTADGRFCLNNANGMPNGTLDIASGIEVQNTGKSFTIGKVTGSGTLGGICTLGGSAGSSNTWIVGDDKNFTFAGKITGASQFTKQGTGKMTFTGSGDFTGVAKVSAGELCLNSTATTGMLGTSTLSVQKGATLSGKGVLTNTTVTIVSGGTLRSGISETSGSGNLQFSDKNVTVNGTCQTFISTKTTYSKFTGIGTLKLNGTLAVKCRDGLELAEGTEIQIFDANTITLGSNLNLELDSPNAAMGLTWDTSRLTEGILVVGPAPVGVKDITADDLNQAEIYTLNGIRLTKPPSQKGIYLVNGVKTLLK